MRPPGETWMSAPNAIVGGRRVRSTSGPSGPGRSSTTVSAGTGTTASPAGSRAGRRFGSDGRGTLAQLLAEGVRVRDRELAREAPADVGSRTVPDADSVRQQRHHAARRI